MNTYEMIKEQGEWALKQLTQTSILTDEVNYMYYQGRLDAVANILMMLDKESEGAK